MMTLDKAPQFASEDAALKALAYGSPVEVIVTLTDETATKWKVKTKRGYITCANGRYRIRRKPQAENSNLPPDSIARIDYADAEQRATSAPFYVREAGE